MISKCNVVSGTKIHCLDALGIELIIDSEHPECVTIVGEAKTFTDLFK